MTVPYEMPEPFTYDGHGNRVPVQNLIARGHPTFEHNIRGHAFNALTEALGGNPWMALSRRLEISDAVADAILAFLAPLGLGADAPQPEAPGDRDPPALPARGPRPPALPLSALPGRL